MSNPDQKSPDRPLLFIPTYNEADNVVALCESIQAQDLDFDILFMDDNSPDGTGKVLDGLVAKYSNVKVLHRSGKLGIGSAHFTPIANKPEVAILGMGRGAMKPVVGENKIEPRLMLPLGLSYDHRVIDGGVAARFMVELVKGFENFGEAGVKL